MKLRNILIGLGILYFLTKKKEKESTDKTAVLIEKKDDSFEVFDLEKKDIDSVSE